MLREQINIAMKEAMTAKEKDRLSTLRLIIAAIKDRDIANRGAGKERVSDDQVLEILAKMIKQREDSASQFEEGGRLELAERERNEINVIKVCLPEQLNEDDVQKICAEVISELEADCLRDMGKCMGVLKERYPGQMDFGKASSIIKSQLQQC